MRTGELMARVKPGNHGSSGLPLIANERVRVMCVREVLSKESRSPLTVSFGWLDVVRSLRTSARRRREALLDDGTVDGLRTLLVSRGALSGHSDLFAVAAGAALLATAAVHRGPSVPAEFSAEK